ncbi:MAG: metallophosphoesterase [Clostridia bacterium]|nr:metallophosphoesterase [Clostridia bacterium]
MKDNKFNRFLFANPTKIILAIIAFWVPFNYFLYQDFHYFIDDSSFWCARYLIAFLMVVTSFFVIVTEWLHFSGKVEFKKPYIITYYVCLCFTIIFTLVNLIFCIFLNSPQQMFRKNFINMAPYFGATLAVFTMAFVATIVNRKKLLAVIVSLLLVSIFVFTGIFSLHLFVFKFESDPVVFDVGDEYIIAWATTDESIGKIEYTYNNEKYVVFDECSGRINSTETIHSVKVPKEHLANNSYTVYSTRMYSNVAYFPQQGNTISTSRTFKGVPNEEIDVAIITDTHNCNPKCFNAPEKESCDVLIMLGDFSDFIADDQAIADYLLSPCSRISKGEIPVIYAKGNHDTRGESATRLQYLLKFDSFYYQTTFGNYTFTVLDSGECNYDNYRELGGVVHFEEYRTNQINWLSNLVKDDTKTNILVVHNPLFTVSDEEVALYNTTIGDFGFDLQLSGHTHEWSYSENGYMDKITTIPVFVSAGVVGDFFKNDLNYSILNMKADKITINCKSFKKGLVNTYSLNI